MREFSDFDARHNTSLSINVTFVNIFRRYVSEVVCSSLRESGSRKREISPPAGNEQGNERIAQAECSHILSFLTESIPMHSSVTSSL